MRILEGKVVTLPTIKDAILGCIHITNVNLINMNNRFQNKDRAVKKVILQSDALAIFKGNMIRVLKQLFDSATINIIKSRMTYVIVIDDVHPTISNIDAIWPELPDYRAEYYKSVRRKVLEAFHDISDGDIMDQAISSLKQVEASGVKIKPNIQSFDDISFDSLTNIKFEVK